MKKLLLALMVLGTLASCGKSNTVSSNGVNTSITNPLVTNNTQAQALVSMISNPSSFGQGAISIGGNQQNCQTKWTIFYYCTTSGSTGTTTTWNQVIASNPNIVYQYSNGTTVRNADIAVATKQQQLTDILNAATRVDVSGYTFYVTTASAQYVIDIRYPIQVNPSGVSSTSGSYYFVQAI